jgi:hypothetical protein
VKIDIALLKVYSALLSQVLSRVIKLGTSSNWCFTAAIHIQELIRESTQAAMLSYSGASSRIRKLGCEGLMYYLMGAFRLRWSFAW